ncbi:MAG: hypothetical protein AAFR47_01375 [Pseudomonadota bacterium]
MQFIEKVAERLAVETFEQAQAIGDQDLVEHVGKSIGASSTTLEEAYFTCIRYLRAEARAIEAREAYVERRAAAAAKAVADGEAPAVREPDTAS